VEKGVTFIGSLIVDRIKIVDYYPPQGNLCNILSLSRCVGGLAANTAINLKVLSPALSVATVGLVGNDDSGSYLVDTMASYGVNVSGIKTHSSLPTSFTDVMTEQETGRRTFFHARGACAAFGYEDIPFDDIQTSMAHIGYALLLDTLDAPDGSYQTGLVHVLNALQERGIQTSIDCITEASERYQSIILPALPYVDTLFMNEIEAGSTVGFSLTGTNGNVINEQAHKACSALLQHGVKKLVVIHAPQGAWAMTKGGDFAFEPALKLPANYIKGTVGAGDAFCAGMLCALADALPVQEGLKIANLAAAANLSHHNSIDGMKPLKTLQAWAKTL
jgi:sugar/nucleoside kinase (ribokinase family)